MHNLRVLVLTTVAMVAVSIFNQNAALANAHAAERLIQILTTPKEWVGSWSAGQWGGGKIAFVFHFKEGVLTGTKLWVTGSAVTTKNVPLVKLEIVGDYTISFETEFGTKYKLTYYPKDNELSCDRTECVYMGQYAFSVKLTPSN